MIIRDSDHSATSTLSEMPAFRILLKNGLRMQRQKRLSSSGSVTCGSPFQIKFMFNIRCQVLNIHDDCELLAKHVLRVLFAQYLNGPVPSFRSDRILSKSPYHVLPYGCMTFIGYYLMFKLLNVNILTKCSTLAVQKRADLNSIVVIVYISPFSVSQANKHFDALV